MEKGEKTRALILQTAAELFGRHGRNGVSTADIAKKANVNKALIFYYFTSKENLYLEVFKHWMGRLSESMNQSFDEAEDGLPRVEAFIRTQIDFLAGHQDMMKVLVREMLAPQDEPSPVVRHGADVFKPIRNKLLLALSTARSKKDIRDVDPVQTVVNIISMNVFFFLGFPLLNIINPSINTGEFRQGRVDSVIDMVMNGLRRRSGEEE